MTAMEEHEGEKNSPQRLKNLPGELDQRKRIISQELAKRAMWFISLRWWVPPAIIFSVIVGHLLGVNFTSLPLVIIAVFILTYNALLYSYSHKFKPEEASSASKIQSFTYYQVILDYLVMFLLIHWTGGVDSPLIFFFIFHIIFASILLPPRSAYGFAIIVIIGLTLIVACEYFGWLDTHPVWFTGKYEKKQDELFYLFIKLFFFDSSVLITAFSTTSITKMLRKRIFSLAELSEKISRLNSKLQSLYNMIQAIGSQRVLSELLKMVVAELASVMNVNATSIKMLSEDGKSLEYVAVWGLPPDFFKDKIIEIDKSPLNKRIVEGEAYVTGEITQREMFQFGEDLASHNIKSVLFVPLKAEKKIIGILGAYSIHEERFSPEEVDFFILAGELVAIALENAKYYSAVEKMAQERSWFMMRVAHNLRAPLNAALSILDVLQGGYLGEIDERKLSYMRRVDYTIRNMLKTINELMVLYAQKSEKKQIVKKPVDLDTLVNRVFKTFRQEAVQKNIKLEAHIPDEIPPLSGEEEMLERVLENLISNAIKYSHEGGDVTVNCYSHRKDIVNIEISDKGIGISKEDMPRLFTEFFRAENAREMVKNGTGLGLPIVKDIITQHGGTIKVTSELGKGTTFIITLPAHKFENAP